MKVSVIVVNHNGMKHIDACLSSVFSQTYRDYEVVLVDNNSSDGSLNYVDKKYPDCILVENKVNYGYAEGINQAMPFALGELIAPLNNDTEVTPTWLESMVKALESNNKAGAVTPQIRLFDDRQTINTMGHNLHVSGIAFCRGLYEHVNGQHGSEPVSGISGCSYLIRRDLLEMIGGVPGDFMGQDDVWLSWLLHLMGYRLYCANAAVMYHKYKLQVSTPDKLFRLEKGRATMILSTLDAKTMVVCLPLTAAIESMVLAFAILKGRPFLSAKLDAWRSLWKERYHIKELRKQYRALRSVSDAELFRSLDWNLNWKQLLTVSRRAA